MIEGLRPYLKINCIKMLILTTILLPFPQNKLFCKQSTLCIKVNVLANNFHILDQVSESLPEFFRLPIYKDKLFDQFKEHREMLVAYRKMRGNHQNIPSFFNMHQPNSQNLFPPNPKEFKDPIFDAFVTSKTISQAYKKLKKILLKEELTLIKTVFLKCEKIFQDIDHQNSIENGLNLNSDILNKNLDSKVVSAHLKKLRAFYQCKNNHLKSITLLWAPTDKTSFTGATYGDHLVIRCSSSEINDPSTTRIAASIIVHEASHHISSNSPEDQKKKLSEAFLSKTEIKEKLKHPLFLLEEPIVLATHMIFYKTAWPDHFRLEQKAWNCPLALKLLPLIENYIENNRPLDENLALQAALLYNN